MKRSKSYQKPSKKASGEATGDHGGSKRIKRGLLDAKNHPRRPAGGQESSKKLFWCHFGRQYGAYFCICSAPKSVPRADPFWDLLLAPFWAPKSDPNRPRSRAFNMALEGPKKCQDDFEDAMHQKMQRSAKISRKRYILQWFWASEPSKSEPDRLNTRLCGQVVGPEATMRTARSESESEIRRETEKMSENGSDIAPETVSETSFQRGPKRSPKMVFRAASNGIERAATGSGHCETNRRSKTV